MDITLSGEMATHLATTLKKDSKLARALAWQFLATVDKEAMAGYLLSGDVALELLTERLRTDPSRTVRELARIANGEPARPKRGRPRGRPSQRSEAAAAKTKRVKRRRKRLSAAQAERLRTQVQTFLEQNPWSSRKQLADAVAFPSEGLYNRIMGELKKAGTVVQKGEKSKAAYAVKGA